MENKRLIFIGFLLPEEHYIYLIKKHSAIDYAGFKCQSALIEGLGNYYEQITIISSPNLTSFPKSNIFIYNRSTEFIKENIKLIITGYLNLPIIKLLSQCFRVFLELSRINKSDTDIIIYSPHSAFIVAVWPFLKLKNNSSLIIPDLPEFMTKSTSKSYLIAKWLDRKIIDLFSKRINSFILFSPLMTERFKTRGKPILVMEGIYKEGRFVKYTKSIKDKIILYTGKADERYGIDILLEAFAMIKFDNYRLYIRGDGNRIGEVMKRSLIDHRIKYIEKLSSFDLSKLQQEATVLVNPVSSKEEFTRYFFPSKTLEYLASGTPTIMSRLKCMPPEYDSYIFYYDDTPESLMNKIIEVCEMPDDEREQFGLKARDFILKRKNELVQANRIKRFISSLNN